MLSLMLVLGVNNAGEKDKKAEPKYTIKEVMMKAHDGDGILSKVLDGKATATEKKELVELYVALHDNAPPKGDMAKWAKVTQSLVDTAKSIDAGNDAKAVKTLFMLANCKACHTEFKAPRKKAG